MLMKMMKKLCRFKSKTKSAWDTEISSTITKDHVSDFYLAGKGTYATTERANMSLYVRH